MVNQITRGDELFGREEEIIYYFFALIAAVFIGVAVYFLTGPKPNIQIEELTVSQEEVIKGDSVTVEVRITNSGGAGGTKEISLKLDGRAVDSRTVTLDSGESRTIPFEVSLEEAGTHQLSAGGLSGTIEVLESVPSPSSPNAVVNANILHQEIEGFGASVAWYRNWLTRHPNKDEIYDLIFDNLGLDILRLRNTYRYQSNFSPLDQEIVQRGEESLGHPITILITSWSPPADLKSNNNVENGGTLREVEGSYVYDDFARYWRDSLEAYKNVGIEPAYISIQNEPDYEAVWESCKLTLNETDSYAGYDLALKATYNELQDMHPPGMLGPATTGIGSNRVQNYLESLNDEYLYGIAYHLYNGGNVSDPDSYNANLREMAQKYPNMPKFMTEFEGGSKFQTAWIIHNNLVQGNASGYLYWELFWNDGGLVDLDNFESRGSWENPKGYQVNADYYAFKQYSKFIHSGWHRASASTESSDLKISAFLSPDEDDLTVVVLNASSQDSELSLDVKSYRIDGSSIYRTSNSENFTYVGEFFLGDNLTLPPKSITTISMQGQLERASTADNTPPSLFIESPSDGEKVEGKVEIEGRATEDFSSLGKVEIRIENGPYQSVKSDFGPSYRNADWSYTWSTFPLPNDNYTLTVRATNLSGKSNTKTLTLEVYNPTDKTPPTISFESPADGARVSGSIEISGSVSDERGIGEIRICVDDEADTSWVYNSSSGTETPGIFTEPVFEKGRWSTTLDTLKISNGIRELKLIATDEYGNTSDESIEIEVNNGGMFATCENEIYWGSYQGGGGSISKSNVSGVEGRAVKATYSGDGGWWGIVKNTYRDFSGYSGMEFYLKGDPNRVRIMIRDGGDEVWTYKLSPTEDWKKVKVPFENFIYRPDWQPTEADQNHVFDLEGVCEFHFIQPLGEERSVEGTLYVDELKLYK